MRLAQTVDTRLQQTQRIDPRQILASEILAWSIGELEAAVERELAENPALEAKESDTIAPSAPSDAAPPMLSLASPSSDRLPASEPTEAESRQSLPSAALVNPNQEIDDPLDRVASQQTLRDHLRGQIGGVGDDVPRDILSYLIENVDDRGYLVADPQEAAERFRATPSMVETAVRALQSLDPAGVGARDLRECLTLQAEFLEQAGEAHPLASRILVRCWDELIARREERIATRLKAPMKEVRAAMAFLQRALTPYPGASFRPSGQREGGGPPARPDILFHRTDSGFVVELARDYESMIHVAPLWVRLAEGESRDEAMRRYIKEHVERAQAFLTGVERRGKTLRAIGRELVHCQSGFLETRNRAFLRPLTRQSLAEKLRLDESVISRAVADKWVMLPGGEVLPLDAFFGNSQAVREALVGLVNQENPQKPYSDDEIADLLTARGFPLARRTVAKYRGIERILPARLRKRKAA